MDRTKRGIDVVENDQENVYRPNKIGRNDWPNPLVNVSNGQRFGQDAAFATLSQFSQFSRSDEDDAGAIDLVQDSQDFDDINVNDFELYGM
jgi:hypothetical protein